MNIPTKPTYYTQEELALQKELRKLQNCHIFVNTNFKRTTQPIFALALLESRRRIKVNAKELTFKTLDEVLAVVSTIIKFHHKETQGNVGIWGKTVNYVYHHIENEVFVFNTDGEIIEDVEVNESRATLKLKGKKIC